VTSVPPSVARVLDRALEQRPEAVFGRPDDRLSGHCERELAAYKIPDTWAVIDALPRNAMGKIVRTQLPALFASATRLDLRAHA
jgi:acyl-coenzyme A synthetase/AMP-(fatty) acid ligase